LAQRSTSALRIAEALFDVARGHQTYDLWLRELGEIEQLLADEMARRVLYSPVVPRDRKSAILEQALPSLSEPVRRFLDYLVRRERLDLIPQINEHLRGLIDRAIGLETAQVTTAIPLGPAERELISSRLSARTGKRVRLIEKVDHRILGGVIAQIGDQIFDDSVRGRLEQLRRTLGGT
jgi:F-type H+-transporting ATPase subunit delta